MSYFLLLTAGTISLEWLDLGLEIYGLGSEICSQGDHLCGKPGNVRELYRCQEFH